MLDTRTSAAEAAGRYLGVAASARPLVRRRRPARRVFLAALAALALLIALGYALLLRHLDPAVARSVVEGNLPFYLQPGERVERRLYVYRRSPWDFFRSTHGVLAATDRRLLALTVVPPERFAPDGEQPVILQRDYPVDTTLALDTGRVMLGLARGVTVASPSGPSRNYAVPAGEWGRLRGLLAFVGQRQAELRRLAAERREAAERERLARLAAIEAARQPVYHVIKPGEALSTIAAAYNTTPERLRQLNALTSDRIRAGDTLLVKPRT